MAVYVHELHCRASLRRVRSPGALDIISPPSEKRLAEGREWLEAGAPGVTRTPDTRFRKPLLYPLSYRGAERIINPKCGLGVLFASLRALSSPIRGCVFGYGSEPQAHAVFRHIQVVLSLEPHPELPGVSEEAG